MPLKPGSDQSTISANISEMMESYKRTGKIGNSTPANADEARKQATAIAHDKARKHFMVQTLAEYAFDEDKHPASPVGARPEGHIVY